ncbi:MAG: thiolase family protein [Planctomycetaceae bacterium]
MFSVSKLFAALGIAHERRTQMNGDLKRLAVISGMRTPFCKAGTDYSNVHAADLGVAAVTAAIQKAGLTPADIDEVVLGNVSGPADAANIARIVAMQAGLPQDRIAHTVNRNCASGMESVLSAWQILQTGRASTIVAGGTESMSAIPLLFGPEATRLFTELSRAKTLGARLKVFARFRPGHFKPVPGVLLGLTDPFCGLNMGQTAEKLAQEFSISREDQDRFALESHRAASAAQERCFLSGEISAMKDVKSLKTPLSGGDIAPSIRELSQDNGPRHHQTFEALKKLRPIFRKDGTVTAGNSCPLTDGGAAVVLTSSEFANRQGLRPLGYVTGSAIVGCDPSRMGLGPVYATARLLKQTGLTLADFDLVEINEAFAAQVLACLAAFESDAFAGKELNLSKALGTVPREKLNVNGGAIALGHPVGTTGTRMLITLLRALREKGLHRGLATLCVGGGQGVAMMVEVS